MNADKVSVPICYRDIQRLYVFDSKNLAEEWLRKNELNINDTPLLIPFKNLEENSIEYLKPLEFSKKIRIIGAANKLLKFKKEIKLQSFFFKSKYNIPRLNYLKGDVIKINKNGFILIYEQSEDKSKRKTAKKLSDFLQLQEKNLKKSSSVINHDKKPEINIPTFIDQLSILGMELNIKIGMHYFVREENQVLKAYRHTFYMDADNDKVMKFLKKEADEKQSQIVSMQSHNTVNKHAYAYLVSLLKYIAIASIGGILSGIIASIFTTSWLACIIALVFFGIFFSTANRKAEKDNPNTIEFGTFEFRPIFGNFFGNFILNKILFFFKEIVSFIEKKFSMFLRMGKNFMNLMSTKIVDSPKDELPNLLVSSAQKIDNIVTDISFTENSHVHELDQKNSRSTFSNYFS